jgi:hypothetical protein
LAVRPSCHVPAALSFLSWSKCFVSSPWRPHIEDKRMVLEHTHGLFIT